jgi:hypothetical protein
VAGAPTIAHGGKTVPAATCAYKRELNVQRSGAGVEVIEQLGTFCALVVDDVRKHAIQDVRLEMRESISGGSFFVVATGSVPL